MVDYEQIKEFVSKDERFRYMFLDRLRTDCEYYLANGRCEKHLWANDVHYQIELMKALWESFENDKKPEWLSFGEILDYEIEMKLK